MTMAFRVLGALSRSRRGGRWAARPVVRTPQLV